MSHRPYCSFAAVRTRMIVLSLIASGIVGGIALMLGSSVPVLLATIITALCCSLLCIGVSHQLVADIRAEHCAVLTRLSEDLELSAVRAHPDALQALFQSHNLVDSELESRKKSRGEQLEQIRVAQSTLRSAVNAWTAGDAKEAAQIQDAVTAMERLNNLFLHVITEIDALSDRTEERASISTQMSATTDAIAENINQYSNFVIETSRSIEEIAGAARETAENIRALSASAEQTVFSINTISTSQSTVRDNSERSALASESVRTQAQHGLRSMVATMKAIQEIAKSNDESFESINRLSRHSARVGEFLSVIQEVVEQTNMLSLNASIIAAQAGSRGHAFAVVAEEVRSLARRTSASTREIEELVRNIQKETASVQRSVTQGKDRVKEGVKISSVANEALVAIDKSAEDAFKMVSKNAVETTEQAVNIQRITEEAEKNLERVQLVSRATAYQQQGSSLVVTNLGHMCELVHQINMAIQEQAHGNRQYLKSIMEDNEQAHNLKNEAAQHIALAKQAVEAVGGVNAHMAAQALESTVISAALTSLTDLIDSYRSETIEVHDEDSVDTE